MGHHLLSSLSPPLLPQSSFFRDIRCLFTKLGAVTARGANDGRTQYLCFTFAKVEQMLCIQDVNLTVCPSTSKEKGNRNKVKF